jgi:hypothetical protein
MPIVVTRCSTGTVLAFADGASGVERLHRLLGFRLRLTDGVEERFPVLLRSHHHAFSRD